MSPRISPIFFLTLSNAIDAPPGKAFIKIGLQEFVTLVRCPWGSDRHSFKIHDDLTYTPFHPWGNVLSSSPLIPLLPLPHQQAK